MKKLSMLAQKCLDDSVVVNGYVSIDLPEFAATTTEVSGAGVMGTLDLPSTAQIESAEITINFRGMGEGRARLMRPGRHNIEIRGVQDVYTQEAGVKPQGVKVFVTCTYKSGGGGSLENASVVEGSATYEIERYEVYVDGNETFVLDKLNYIYRILGVDYAQDIRGFLD